MNEQPVSVTRVSWMDLCPWTIIFKTLSIALSPAVLVWALLGIVVTPIGWLVAERLTFDDSMKENLALVQLAEVNRSPFRGVFEASESGNNAIDFLGAKFSGPRLVFDQISRPFRALFFSGWNLREFLYFLIGCTWSILVWTFAGCAITRVSALRLTRNEPIGIDDAFDFAVSKYLDCLGAVAMPLVAVAILCIPMAIIGLIMGSDVGVLIVGVFWFLVLAAAGVMAFLLIGLLFGWPLIVSSVSTEGQNSFDAVARSFAYLVQKPLNCLFYALVAIFFGGFCWLIVGYLTNTVIDLGHWSTSWGSNRFEGRAEVIRGISDPLLTNEAGEIVPVSNSLRWGRNVIEFWNGIARTLAAAFLYGLFWSMASAVYLLLRHDVDETEMDEVFLVDEKRTYDLPPLQSDELGIPQVQKPVAREEPPTGNGGGDSDPPSGDG